MKKTTWQIAGDRILLFPVRVYKPLAIAMAVIFLVIWYLMVMTSPELQQGTTAIKGYVFITLVSALLFFWGGTSVVFDNTKKRMYKMIGGMIPTSGISFDEIAAIQEVTGTHGLVFRAFKRSDRHGKGIAVSSYYGGWKSKDANQFHNEVLPKIGEMVFGKAEERPINTYVPITDFTFYEEKNNLYVMKQKRTGLVVFLLLSLVWCYYAVKKEGTINFDNAFQYWAFLVFPFIIALACLIALFTNYSFDKQNRKIIRSYFGGIYKKESNFDDFIRFTIIRKSTNFMYSGTEVRMELRHPSQQGRILYVTMRRFSGTGKIQRFLEETHNLLGTVAPQ
ncbi:hypothetical protein [Chitinophaga sp. Cy-1792]|uniref:hypothetical protein n=1 Tax=Chitinophaga sp. Cy-1792 TaxID=2608339 RepID=UPI001422E85E|nr:hypothetical protein [Chitinophaga sp. Cy-1792]NIG56516.1 hypothetical protein [Chitinophaga sp. Cy-1792]